MKLKVRNIIFILFFIVLCIGVASIDVEALEKKVKFRTCTVSDEYLEWEKLSEEEKEKTLAPPMCDSDADKVESLNNGISLLFESEEDELPAMFDGRVEDYASSVKNQSNTGACWAFSTTSALEYYSAKILKINNVFSPRHIVYATTREFLDGTNEFGYNKTASSGGNFFMSSSYLVNNLGPVLESDMPFEDNEDTLNISSIQNKISQFDVNNMIINYDSNFGTVCTASEIEEIKEYVYKYGAVVMSTYMSSSALYYNSTTAAYYYNGSYSSNHAVTIVGWDDNYSKDNFSAYNQPSSDGAWIVQNSYGTDFGDNGYYYVSYEDVRVCDIYMVITDVDEDVEDNVYVYDNLGFNTFSGFTSSGEEMKSAYAMNVFDKDSGIKEVLKEVTIGTGGVGTYKIYYTEGDGSSKTISNMELIGSGSMDSIGYITYQLKTPITIGSDVSKFSIAVYYEMDESTVPLVLSTSNSTFYQYITLDSGKSYVSSSGKSWSDLVDLSSYTLIASIKAYTNNVIESVTSDTYQVDSINKVIYVQPNVLIDDFLINVDVTDESYSIDKYSDYTGNIYTGFSFEGYTVVVLGDVTGDGYAKMNDVMMISKYIVDGVGLDGYYKFAADVNMDSNIKMNDVMKISNYIVEGGTL